MTSRSTSAGEGCVALLLLLVLGLIFLGMVTFVIASVVKGVFSIG